MSPCRHSLHFHIISDAWETGFSFDANAVCGKCRCAVRSRFFVGSMTATICMN
jgi:hypothetical protein